MFTSIKRATIVIAMLFAVIATFAASPNSTIAANDLAASGTVGNGTFEGTIINPVVYPDQHGYNSYMSGELVGVAEIDGETVEFAFEFEVVMFVNSVDCETVKYIFTPFFADDLGGELQLNEILTDAPEQGVLGGLLGSCGILGGLL